MGRKPKAGLTAPTELTTEVGGVQTPDWGVERIGTPTPDREEPTSIGPFRILATLGEGGMGVVYRAEQKAPVRREVALKVVRGTLRSAAARERFLAERQALARLDHQSISRLYEAGTTIGHEPWFAMEFVDGESLLDFCDHRKLGLHPRLEILIDICRAVQFAHTKGILHRDLKPANILVTESEGRPLPKIIDFGIAKSLDQPLTEQTLLTRDGILGTPSYMSPEALIHPTEVDTRSDVFSLGVILYRLLSGVFPAAEQDLPSLIQHATQGDTESIDKRFASLDRSEREEVAEHRGLRAEELRRALVGELSWIAERAAAADPDRRYPSAAALADDLQRYLDDEPLSVGPPTLTYRSRKFLRRHRLAAVAAALVVLSLLAGAVATGLALGEARRALSETEAVATFLRDLFRGASPWSGQSKGVPVETIVLEGVRRVETELQDQPRVRARVLDTLAGVVIDLGRREKGIELHRESLELKKRLYGPESLEVASTLNNLGMVMLWERRITEAETLIRRANAYRSRIEGADSRRLSRGYADLADVVDAAGRYDEAEELLRESLRIAAVHYGTDSLDFALKEQRLAQFLGSRDKRPIGEESRDAEARDRIEEADRRFLSALDTLRDYASRHRYEYARCLKDYGSFLSDHRRGTEAYPLLMEAVPILEDVWGEDSTRLLAPYVDIGIALSEMERTEEAIAIYEKAVRITRETLGARAYPMPVLALNLGEAHLHLGHLEIARAYFEESVATWRELEGDEYGLLGAPIQGLGVVELRVGDLDAAEAHFLRARELLQAELGTGHEITAEVLWNLARVHLARGRRSEALPLLERALEVHESILSDDHPMLRRTRATYEEARGDDSGGDARDRNHVG